MPVGPGKYRVTSSWVRIHITPGGTVNEAKNMQSGATHTPSEFKADRKKERADFKKRVRGGLHEPAPKGK